ncbi:MAG: Rieske (2Fe-2S) protein [Cyanobacteria bacterium]|nr:Rieske (2Fe-2S) protein [Cyanobacteriota bacterium]
MDSAANAVPRASGSDRREFVADLVLSAAGIVGLGGLATRFLQYLYPVVPPEQVIEVAAGRRDAVPANGGIVVNLGVGHVALVDAGGELRAFSAVCTHLGCIVKAEPTDHHALYCACHGGMFDRQGEVVGGPPPRPLPRYPVEVRDGQVFVKVIVRPPVLTA